MWAFLITCLTAFKRAAFKMAFWGNLNCLLGLRLDDTAFSTVGKCVLNGIGMNLGQESIFVPKRTH